MKKYLILLPLALIACSKPQTVNVNITPDTASQEIYRIEGYYAAARTVENAYYDLPRCGTPAAANTVKPLLCSNLTALRKVRKADNIAYAAIIHADDLINAPGATDSEVSEAIAVAKASVDTFRSLSTQLRIK